MEKTSFFQLPLFTHTCYACILVYTHCEVFPKIISVCLLKILDLLAEVETENPFSRTCSGNIALYQHPKNKFLNKH